MAKEVGLNLTKKWNAKMVRRIKLNQNRWIKSRPVLPQSAVLVVGSNLDGKNQRKNAIQVLAFVKKIETAFKVLYFVLKTIFSFYNIEKWISFCSQRKVEERVSFSAQFWKLWFICQFTFRHGSKSYEFLLVFCNWKLSE